MLRSDPIDEGRSEKPEKQKIYSQTKDEIEKIGCWITKRIGKYGPNVAARERREGKTQIILDGDPKFL
jgi:hypothetical protein